MRAALAILVFAGCAAPEAPVGIAKADLAGEWEHHLTVLGAEGGEPVPAAESTATVRFQIDEALVSAVTEGGDPRVVLRVLDHLPDPTDPLATRDVTAGDFGGGTICEGPECPRWWERPRMRVDTGAELRAALPIDGSFEPLPLGDGGEEPELDASGRLVWRFEAVYLLHATDPAIDGRWVHVRHELTRLE